MNIFKLRRGGTNDSGKEQGKNSLNHSLSELEQICRSLNVSIPLWMHFCKSRFFPSSVFFWTYPFPGFSRGWLWNFMSTTQILKWANNFMLGTVNISSLINESDIFFNSSDSFVLIKNRSFTGSSECLQWIPK